MGERSAAPYTIGCEVRMRVDLDKGEAQGRTWCTRLPHRAPSPRS